MNDAFRKLQKNVETFSCLCADYYPRCGLLPQMTECKICGKLFPQTFNLKRHIERHHSGKKSYICSVCLSGFETYKEMRAHKVLDHKRSIEFHCPNCSKCFTNNRNCLIHTARCNKKWFGRIVMLIGVRVFFFTFTTLLLESQRHSFSIKVHPNGGPKPAL